MVVLLVLIVVSALVGLGLLVVMYRRDMPLFGAAAIGALILAGMLSVGYGVLGAGT